MLSELLLPLIAVGAPALGLLVVLQRDALLPAQFLYDSEKIQTVAQGQLYDDPAFDIVGSIYRMLGLASSPTAAGLIAYFLFLAVLYYATFRSTPRPALSQVLVFAIATFVGSVYLGGYSKEAFLIPIVAMVLIARKGWFREALLIGTMLIYAADFRSYWYLVVCAYIGLRYILRRPWAARWYVIVLAAIFLVVVMSFAVYFGLHRNPDDFRVSVNDIRDQQISAATVISPFISGPQPVVGVLNNVLTGFALVFPFPVVAIGGLYYLVIAVIIGTLWLSFFSSVRDKLKFHFSEVKHYAYWQRSVALTLAFLAVQCLFEPDYGSALRHITPLLPMMVAVIKPGFSSPGVHRARSEP